MDIKKNCGIYCFKNKITGETYIGSSIHLIRREREHIWLLKKGIHHSYKFQKSHDLYGIDNFVFFIICHCQVSILVYMEQLYLKSMNPILNMTDCVESPMRGRKHRPETLEKMKGKLPWNKGLPRTEEEKAYMSLRRKEAANNQSKEDKEKYRKRSTEFLKANKPFKGKTHTEERKKLIRKGFIDKHGPIFCIENGKIYEAQLDAALDLKIRQGHISEHLQGKRKTASGYTFKSVKDL